MTGITPLLGGGARDAWDAALEAAHAHGVSASLDLNHRPALGTLEELWAMTSPHLGRLSMLILSEDSLHALACREGVWRGGAASSDHAAQRAALAALQAAWQVPLVACCFKRRLGGTPSEPSATGPGQGAVIGAVKDTRMGGAGVRRWSVVAMGGAQDGAHKSAHDGVLVSSEANPVEHVPLEALGGGDAWIAGFLDAAMDVASEHAASASGARPRMSAAACAFACRRGDLLAVLSMASYGDQSTVSGHELLLAEREWSGTTARLIGCGSGDDRITAVPSAGAIGGGSGGARASAPPLPSTASAVYERFGRCKLIPVVALDDPSQAVLVARALLAGGMDVMELVLRTDAAEEALGRISEHVPEMLVGAGTVLTAAQAERAVQLGAQFLVSPGTNADVVRRAPPPRLADRARTFHGLPRASR